MLAIGRYADDEKVIGIFNFSEFDKTITLPYDKGEFTDLLTGTKHSLTQFTIPAYGSFYMQQRF